NMLMFDHHGDDDEYDMWLRTDDDSLNDSDSDNTTIGHNTPVIIDGDSDSDYYVNKTELSPDENTYSMSPPVAKSIPYGSYLRRYKQSPLKSSATPFHSLFLQPP
ncbi:9509_t:CDS:2, partial [Racocetra fulgida]